jgi:membrane fusion protein (multidrug efflux system)
LTGRLTSANAEIRAPIDGIIDEVQFKEGDRVTKGQTLATLNRRKLATALAQAESRYKQAEVTLQRQQQLVEKNLAAHTELDQATAAADEARAAIVLAKEALADGMVLAPFAGVVSSARAQVGEVVNRGARLGTVVEVDALKAEFDVPESMLGRLQIGREIRVRHPSSADTFPARVSFISPEVDSGSGTVRVKAELENPRGRLRPGSTVQAVLSPGKDQEGGADAPERAKQP